MRDFAEWLSHFKDSISDYSYYTELDRCRVAHRGNGAPVSNDFGFRVARTVKPED